MRGKAVLYIGCDQCGVEIPVPLKSVDDNLYSSAYWKGVIEAWDWVVLDEETLCPSCATERVSQ